METVCNQVTEDGDSDGEAGFEEERLTAAGHDFLSETAEATGFLTHLNSTEPTDEEQAEQTGVSLIQTSISHYHDDDQCHSRTHGSTFFCVDLQI